MTIMLKYLLYAIVLLLYVTTHGTIGMEDSHSVKMLMTENKNKKKEEENGGEKTAEKFEQHHITWGRPHSDTAYFHPDTPTNLTVIVGQKARLPCTVFNIEQEDVSWIRQRDLHILTVGIFTYTSDDRFKVYHPERSSDWYLEISSVTFRDAGVYECQVSTSPKIFLPVILTVEASWNPLQQARIQSPPDIFIQNGSTISLTCIVKSHNENVGSVKWFRDTTELDYDSPRGGVSLEVEKTPSRTTSKLFLTRATKKDSGNYTCAPQFADAGTVIVHVVNGEESAAVQAANSVSPLSDGGGGRGGGALGSIFLLLVLLLYHRYP